MNFGDNKFCGLPRFGQGRHLSDGFGLGIGFAFKKARSYCAGRFLDARCFLGTALIVGSTFCRESLLIAEGSRIGEGLDLRESALR